MALFKSILFHILLNKMEELNAFMFFLFQMLGTCQKMHTLIMCFGRIQLLLLILYIMEFLTKVSITKSFTNSSMVKKWSFQNLRSLDVKFSFTFQSSFKINLPTQFYHIFLSYDNNSSVFRITNTNYFSIF